MCEAIELADLPSKRLVSITTDGTPSMTGKKQNKNNNNNNKKNRTSNTGIKKVKGGKCRASSCSALHYKSTGTVQQMKVQTYSGTAFGSAVHGLH